MPFPDGRFRTAEAAQQIANAVGVPIAPSTLRRWLNEKSVPEPGWALGRRRERAFSLNWINEAIRWYRKDITWSFGQEGWD